MNLSGRLIDAFLALEETRRFSLAAQRCHMSPSAFSQMIGRLEEQVGARLFDRDTRNVALTAEGEVFSRGARRIADEMKGTLAQLRDRAQCRVGRVGIAALPPLAADWLPQRMARFRDAHPGVELRLFDVVSDRCLELVVAGEVDFALSARRGAELGLQATPLLRERCFLVCRADDPLARRRSVRLRDLRHRPFIHTVRSGGLWRHLQSAVQAAGVDDTGLEVNQLATLAGLVAAGFGVSIVPRHGLALCRRPGVAAVPMSSRTLDRPLYAVRKAGRTLSAAAAAFLDALVADPPDAID